MNHRHRIALGCVCAVAFISCDAAGTEPCKTTDASRPLCPSVSGIVVDEADADATSDMDDGTDARDAEVSDGDASDVNDLGCDGTRCDGACVNTQDDPRHCGGCAIVCPGGDHAMPVCAMGQCALRCEAPWETCDGDGGGSCATNLNTSPTSCGSCGRRCTSGPHQIATCTAGDCRVTCEPGYADCDDAGANGCEVDMMSDPLHCGACTTRCGTFHVADGGCVGGMCTISACEGTFGNCDGMNPTGCEIDTFRNRTHCGTCGNACASGYDCLGDSGIFCCGALNALCPVGDSGTAIPPCCSGLECRVQPDASTPKCCKGSGAPCDASTECCSTICSGGVCT